MASKSERKLAKLKERIADKHAKFRSCLVNYRLAKKQGDEAARQAGALLLEAREHPDLKDKPEEAFWEFVRTKCGLDRERAEALMEQARVNRPG